MPSDVAFTKAVRAALRQSCDPALAPAMQAYMKSEMPFLGVRKSQLNRVLRPVFARYLPSLDRQERLAAALELWDQAQYREERYAALALLRRKPHPVTAQDVEFLRHLVVSGAWWDLVDEIATKLVGPVREGLDIRAWAVESQSSTAAIWVRRTAIICQVGAKTATDSELLRDVIEPNTADRRFWITKAIGWSLRDYARTNPDWVRDFVSSHELAPLSVREATKHL